MSKKNLQTSLRPSRIVRNQDSSKGLSDYSSILHLSTAIGRRSPSEQATNDVPQTIFRMAIRFGLPGPVALFFQDIGSVYQWAPEEVDANRELFEKRNWKDQHILMLKAFIWRGKDPFERNTMPYVEYEKAIRDLVALIPQGQVTPADVALVL